MSARRALSLRLLVVAVAALGISVGVAGGATANLDRQLARTLLTPGVVASTSTAMVVDLPSGNIVFAHNPDASLQPASNEKLSITYTALVELGAAYRFPTTVFGEGHRIGDTWDGRLVLKGSGDPSLTSDGLRLLVRALWRDGIRHVTGGVVGDASIFDGMRVAPGWLAAFAGTESPPLSGLVVDRAARNNRLVADPELAAAARFDQLLHARGITARGARTGRAWAHAVPLATAYSDPLSRIIEFMDHYSDNFTAEMLLKAIGAKAGGAGTTAAGAQVVMRDLQAAGVPLTGVTIIDGSGLSRDDRVTARELSAILVKIWNNPTMRTVIWNSLAIAGQSGTLQNRLSDNPNRAMLRGKTGTTDDASALSGYIGTHYAFVTIENGEPVNYWAAHTAEDGVADALIDQLTTG